MSYIVQVSYKINAKDNVKLSTENLADSSPSRSNSLERVEGDLRMVPSVAESLWATIPKNFIEVAIMYMMPKYIAVKFLFNYIPIFQKRGKVIYYVQKKKDKSDASKQFNINHEKFIPILDQVATSFGGTKKQFLVNNPKNMVSIQYEFSEQSRKNSPSEFIRATLSKNIKNFVQALPLNVFVDFMIKERTKQEILFPISNDFDSVIPRKTLNKIEEEIVDFIRQNRNKYEINFGLIPSSHKKALPISYQYQKNKYIYEESKQ